MFRLDKILEHWTTIYKPMQHNPSATAKPEEKAFFLIDRFDLENEWTRVFNVLKKPCLCYSTTIDAELTKDNQKAVVYNYGFYLLAKQRVSNNYMQDDEGAAETKYDLNGMVLDLMAWLFAVRSIATGKTPPSAIPGISVKDILLDPEMKNGLRGLQLERMSWWSAPRLKNGWWVLGVELDGIDPRPLCINQEDYISE